MKAKSIAWRPRENRLQSWLCHQLTMKRWVRHPTYTLEAQTFETMIEQLHFHFSLSRPSLVGLFIVDLRIYQVYLMG